MRSNDANGQKKAPTRGSRDGNTRARRAAAHPNVHLTPRTAGQLPTWGQVLVHALVRAQFGLNDTRVGAQWHVPRRDQRHRVLRGACDQSLHRLRTSCGFRA